MTNMRIRSGSILLTVPDKHPPWSRTT